MRDSELPEVFELSADSTKQAAQTSGYVPIIDPTARMDSEEDLGLMDSSENDHLVSTR